MGVYFRQVGCSGARSERCSGSWEIGGDIQRPVLWILALSWAATALGQGDPSGIDFVTVGAPNNLAYNRDDPQGLITGRGSVPYEYRIGRYEVTTGEWLEF